MQTLKLFVKDVEEPHDALAHFQGKTQVAISDVDMHASGGIGTYPKFLLDELGD